MSSKFAFVTIIFVVFMAADGQEAVNSSLGNCPSYLELSNVQFKVDEAIVTINGNNISYPVEIYFLSEYCYKCLHYCISSITMDYNQTSTTFSVDSKWGSNLWFKGPGCSKTINYHFAERANYSLNLYENEKAECYITPNGFVLHNKPYNTYAPIGVAAAILFGLCIIYIITDKALNRKRQEPYESRISTKFSTALYTVPVGSASGEIVGTSFLKNSCDFGCIEANNSTPTLNCPPKGTRKRLVSIDAFRGICIVVMVFVNYGGGAYWIFEHVAWDGLAVADLVFPWFMFIMGINIVFSIDSLTRKATPAKEITYKITRRTLILFFLGMFIINHNTDFVNLRVPGVLQRFAVAYLIVAVMQWAFHKQKCDFITMVVMASSDKGDKLWWYHVLDVVIYWPQWLIIAAFEVVWHCLTFMLPVDGCPTGYIGPGGLADDGRYFDCIGGAAAYIDKLVFGDDHIYGHPTAKSVYYPPSHKSKEVFFDPEGLLGTFHSILIVFLGLQAGKIFLYYDKPRDKIIRFITWCLLLGTISAILTKCSQFDGWIPVNKNLWSTSFVTTLSCFAFAILCFMYVVVDIKKLWSGVPFHFVGMNSIFVYAGHQILEGYLPFGWGAGDTSTHAELLAMNMLGTAYWVIIAYYCYKIKFFVKI